MNETILSWTGLNGNLTFNETLGILYQPHLDDYNITGNGNTTTNFLIPIGLCKVYKGMMDRFINIPVVGSQEIYQYFAFISDPAAANQFQVPYSLSTGDKIKLDTSSSALKYVSYNIQLKETSVETKDGTCTTYPYRNHGSYLDCVDMDLRERILPSLGCTVPWISGADKCGGSIQRLPEQEDLFQWLYSIGLYSWGGIPYDSAACPLPCTTLSAHSTFQTSGGGDMQSNFIELYFEENVQVEKVRSIYLIKF